MRPKNFMSKWAEFFLTRYRLGFIILFAMVVWSISALIFIPREFTPDVKIPQAIVTTIFRGALPEDVESLVTKEIEEKLSELDDVKQMSSTSIDSVSSIQVEFRAGLDIDEKVREVRDKAREATPELPAEVEDDPIVTDIDFNDIPILSLNLSSDTYDDVQLKAIAEDIEDELERLDGVNDVEVLGGKEREILVLADPLKLESYGVSFSEVISTIQAANINLPGGDIEVSNKKYNIRTVGEFQKPDEISDLVIRSDKNRNIYISDVAEVIDGFADERSRARITLFHVNGDRQPQTEPTVSMNVFKVSGANIIEVVERSLDRIDALKGVVIPENVRVTAVGNRALDVEEQLNDLGMDVLSAIFIVLLLLMLFLNFRSALIVAFSIPLSLGFAVSVIYLQGGSLNEMTLFALVLVVGVLVDDAIVLTENISVHLSKQPNPALKKRAIIDATGEIGFAFTSGSLTTMSAFIPMLLATGILGQYIKFLPLTAIYSLTASLFIALSIVPIFAYFLLRRKELFADNKRLKKIIARYERVLRRILGDLRLKRRLILLTLFAFIISISLPFSGLLKSELFPEFDADIMTIDIELKKGMVLEETNRVAERVEEHILDIEEIEQFVTLIGRGASLDFSSQAGGGDSLAPSHKASIQIYLTDTDDRERTSFEVARDIRKRVRTIPGATIRVNEQRAGPPLDAPIVVRLSGNDFAVLESISNDLSRILAEIPGAVDVDNGIEEPYTTYELIVDKEKAKVLGLSTLDIARTVRTAINGDPIATFKELEDEFDIVVKLQQQYKEGSFDYIKNLRLTTSSGLQIPLSHVAKLELKGAMSQITRRDEVRTISITSQVSNMVPSVIVEEFKKRTETYDLPRGYAIDFGGDDEEMKQSFIDMYYALSVAFVVIYLILVAQFNSFRLPLIILTALPLALIGVLPGLWLGGYSLSFPAFIGIVALIGVVVNDSIVLIDRMNQNMDKGLSLVDAIVQAGTSRFRPIILTTLTTICGLIPISLRDRVWGTLSFTVIFGLLFSTILSLIIIPILYSYLRKD